MRRLFQLPAFTEMQLSLGMIYTGVAAVKVPFPVEIPPPVSPS